MEEKNTYCRNYKHIVVIITSIKENVQITFSWLFILIRVIIFCPLCDKNNQCHILQTLVIILNSITTNVAHLLKMTSNRRILRPFWEVASGFWKILMTSIFLRLRGFFDFKSFFFFCFLNFFFWALLYRLQVLGSCIFQHKNTLDTTYLKLLIQ